MLHAAKKVIARCSQQACLLNGESATNICPDRHGSAISGSWLLLGTRTGPVPLASSNIAKSCSAVSCCLTLVLCPAGRTPESAIKALDADYRQYRLLENQLLQKRARLVGKLPEIQKAKNAVEMLTKKAADQEEVRQWGFCHGRQTSGAGVGAPQHSADVCSAERSRKTMALQLELVGQVVQLASCWSAAAWLLKQALPGLTT